MKKYILDACALISFLNNEKGAEIVEELLLMAEESRILIFMHSLNIYEVYYGVYREVNKSYADKIYNLIENLPIEIVGKINFELLENAAKYKSRYKMSLADSIVLGEGDIRSATIVTSDHHELDIVEQNEEIKFLWIR